MPPRTKRQKRAQRQSNGNCFLSKAQMEARDAKLLEAVRVKSPVPENPPVEDVLDDIDDEVEMNEPLDPASIQLIRHLEFMAKSGDDSISDEEEIELIDELVARGELDDDVQQQPQSDMAERLKRKFLPDALKLLKDCNRPPTAEEKRRDSERKKKAKHRANTKKQVLAAQAIGHGDVRMGLIVPWTPSNPQY